MKSNFYLLLFCLSVSLSTTAQQKDKLTLQDAVETAIHNSDDAQLARMDIEKASEELKIIKNNQYPDLSISGQYNYLTHPTVDLQVALPSSENTDSKELAFPDVNQLLLGQASLSVPLFSGFKLTSAVEAGENNLKATNLEASSTKEKIALHTINMYLNLYKAQKMVKVVEENLRSAQQRVKDFKAMEQNGLLARNDLLKAQLQEDNFTLALQEARKNAHILNYQLSTFLKLPKETTFAIPEETIAITPEVTENSIQRAELEALGFRQKAADSNIKMAKSAYFPSVALVGGYIAMDLNHALTVSNAMNIGVGLKYNLSDLFKNKHEVKLAQHRAEELDYQMAKTEDEIKVQVENAQQEYILALQKSEVYTKSLEQAVENYRIVKDKYDNGLVDTNDLLEAEVDQLQSKINSTNSRADISLKYYQLLQAEGLLTNKFNFTIN